MTSPIVTVFAFIPQQTLASKAPQCSDKLDSQVVSIFQAIGISYVSVRQTHLDHTILPRAPQNHAHLQGFSKRLVKSPWFGIRA